MSSMNFPEDFPARNEQIGVMAIDTQAIANDNDDQAIYIDMWGERVEIEGKTAWPIGGNEWPDMLKRNGLKLKKTKRQTNIIRG